MKFVNARVSTHEQNLDLQVDALKAAGCERIYQEKASGSKAERPELLRMLDQLRTGDTVIIWKLDRIGRSLAHLIKLVSDLENQGVGKLSLNDPIDTTTPQGRLVFRIFASLAEFDCTGEPAGCHSGAYDGRRSLGPSTGEITGKT